MTFELGDWEIKLRPYRWLFIIVLAIVGYQIAGWDVVMLVLLASFDVETKEEKNDL